MHFVKLTQIRIALWVVPTAGCSSATNSQTPTSSSTLKGSDRYIAAWLTIRAGWVNSLLALGPQHIRNPGTQHWRDFLANKVSLVDPVHDISSPVVINTAQPNLTSAKRRKEKVAQEAKEIFRLRLQEKELPKRVFWQEQAIQVGDTSSLTPAITAEVLWDLFESNFRMELRALDRCVMEDEWTDPVKAAVRDDLVQAVFPGDGACLVGRLPSEDVGLAAPAWRDRLKFIESFRVLLSDWPGETACQLKANKMLVLAAKGVTSWTIKEKDVLSIERQAVQFYCQTFFDCLGRAPISPHRLPRKSTGSTSISAR
jgi:hypothetical protein